MSNSQPLVSIIIPTYNRADYVGKAINSVISQTFSNWEILVWDDGSNDNTKEIISKFNDKRIFYFFDENKGVSFARNSSIGFSKGEYIAFLDSDDQWVNEKLEIQVGYLQKYQCIDLVFSNYENNNIFLGTNHDGFIQNKSGLNNLQTEKLEKNLFLINHGIPESILISNFIATDTVILRKSVLENCGLFRTDLRNGEDFELWWRIGLNNFRFSYTDRILLQRTKPLNSLSSPDDVNYHNMIKALTICQEEAKNFNKNYNDLFVNSFKRTYQGLFRYYSLSGDRKNLIKIFKNSFRYGISFKGYIFFLVGMLSPISLRKLRRV